MEPSEATTKVSFASSDEANQQISRLCEEFWEWRLRTNPEFASYCGIHKYDNQLENIDSDSFLSQQNYVQEMLKRSHDINDTSVCSTSKRNLILLRHELKTFISGLEFKGWFFPLNFFLSFHIEIDKIISFMNFKTEEDFRIFNRRIKAYVKKLIQCKDVLKQGIREGLTNHIVTMEKVPSQIHEIVSADFEVGKSLFLAPYESPPNNIDKDAMERFLAKTVDILKTDVIPAFVDLKQFVENVYFRHLRPHVGVHSLPNGKAFFQQCLNFHLSLEMTPEEIHDIGLKEVGRIEKEMQKISKAEGFGSDLAQFKKYLEGRDDLYFKSGEELVQNVKGICHRIREVLPKAFNYISKSQLIVKPFHGGPAGFYLAGTVDGSRPGTYYVNAGNYRGLPKYEAMALSLHEGEPGHHLQRMFALEKLDLPKFRTNIDDMNYPRAPSRFSFHSAYIEGWCLYCEYLGEELGLYKDRYSLFGRYCLEMKKAVRLVLDTGIHAFGWTFEESLEYMKKKVLMDAQHVYSECCRYVTFPGQSSSYKIGELKIKELRAKASSELGDKFDLRRFHESVLECGPVPLSVLEDQINEFIKISKESL